LKHEKELADSSIRQDEQNTSKINYDSHRNLWTGHVGFRVAALAQTPNVEARMASSDAAASTFKGFGGVQRAVGGC